MVQQLADRFLNDIRNDLAKDRLVLPSLPDVVLRVWMALEAKDANARRIADAIARDPALSVRLLRVANSAFYGQARKPVTDLARAVARLGNKLVRYMVAILEVAQVYNVKAHPLTQPHLEHLWHESTLIATLAELIARRLPHLSPEEALLAGLIHRIGMLPILVRAETVPAILNDPRILRGLAETLEPEVGRTLLTHWQFPPELVAVAAEHDDLTRESPGLADYVDVVQTALLMAYQGTEHPLGQVVWGEVPATLSVGLEPEDGQDMLEYASVRAAELRTTLRGRPAAA